MTDEQAASEHDRQELESAIDDASAPEGAVVTDAQLDAAFARTTKIIDHARRVVGLPPSDRLRGPTVAEIVECASQINERK